MKASELCDAARGELYKGWTQRTYRASNGNVCAIGALERVAVQNMAIQQAGVVQRELNAKCREMFGRMSVPNFNDDRNTTKEDVLALFDKATISLEERGL